MRDIDIKLNEDEINIIFDALDALDDRIEKHNKVAILGQIDKKDIKNLKTKFKDIFAHKSTNNTVEPTETEDDFLAIFQEGFNPVATINNMELPENEPNISYINSTFCP